MEDITQHFEAFAGIFDALDLVAAFFFVAVISETVWDFFVSKHQSWKESLANYTILIVNALLERTAYGAVFLIGLVLVAYQLPYNLPVTWWSWILAIIVADFTYYWMHRFEHEIRILWAYHSTHHSSPEFNLTTSLRLSWVEGLIEWIFFIPMLLLGFDVVQTIAAISVVVIYQTWIHTQKIGKLGWFDKIFNSPANHRVHHASNGRYLDKNHGGILMVWDQMFGTYQKEEEAVVYGVTKPLETSNPLIINFHEFWMIANDVFKAGRFSDALGYIFRKPGWAPTKTRS